MGGLPCGLARGIMAAFSDGMAVIAKKALAGVRGAAGTLRASRGSFYRRGITLITAAVMRKLAMNTNISIGHPAA
jgi:hypothetical protein